MRYICFFVILNVLGSCQPKTNAHWHYFTGDNKKIELVGRFDFSVPKAPKVWAPGAYIRFRFQGTACNVELLNELKFGTTHNYISICIDGGKPKRIRLKKVHNWIVAARHLKNGIHTVVICKDTESAIGFVQLKTIACDKLLHIQSKKKIIEFIGDSITCGNGSDQSELSCDEGRWYDHHNAYLSYGPLIARQLDMDYYLSAVSGIGLTRSCCGTSYVLPQVYGSIDFKPGSKQWNKAHYRPEIVCITLGQNDGIQRKNVFIAHYIRFVRQLSKRYPTATFCICSSPMGTKQLKAYHAEVLPRIQKALKQKRISVTIFNYKGIYRSGCMHHPTVAQHRQMANELVPILRALKNPVLTN